jgi:hypothetical protein
MIVGMQALDCETGFCLGDVAKARQAEQQFDIIIEGKTGAMISGCLLGSRSHDRSNTGPGPRAALFDELPAVRDGPLQIRDR